MIYALTIPGKPRTKKTSNRIVRAGRFPKILPSEAHEEWYTAARWYLKSRWHEPPIATPVEVGAVFYRDANRGDLCGYLQALGDLLQAAGVIANDALIKSWDGSRLLKDAANPRIEVTIGVMDAANANQ